jgi:tRNA-intron endonuclease
MLQLFGNRVKVTDEKEMSALEGKGYGERNKGFVLSPEETLYLAEKKLFSVRGPKGRKMSLAALMRHFSKDKDFPLKYMVFKDMRDRGYIVKTGFKFGSHFRVYARGERPGKGHALWLLHCVPEEFTAKFSDISRAVRLSQNVRKKMIYAVADKEGDITYYKIERITP